MGSLNTNKASRQEKLVNLSLFAVGLIPLLLFIFVFLQRIYFPFDIEWAEGAAVNQVNRILGAQPLYAPPDIHFSALVYTPLYYYLAAALVPLAGSALAALRLISAVCTLAAFGLLFWLVFRQSGHFLSAWLAASLYLACFSISDGFYDLARVDSLYVMVLLSGLVMFLRARKYPGYVLAGIWVAAAFFVKQSALLAFTPLIVYCLIKDLRKAWPLLAAIGLGLVIPLAAIHSQTDGWFSYYIFFLPAQHSYSLLSAMNFWVVDILRPLGITAVFVVFYLLRLGLKEPDPFAEANAQEPVRLTPLSRTGPGDPGPIMFMFVMGVVISSWLTRSSNGGGANNSMAAYAGLALLFGVSLNWSFSLAGRSSNKADFRVILLAAAVTIQFAGLLYNPFRFVPSALDRKDNLEIMAAMESSPGEILIPFRSHLPALVGKDAYIHIINLFELTGYFKGEVQPVGDQLVNEFRAKVCSQEYDLIILDQPIAWLDQYVEAAYRKLEIPQQDEKGYRSEAQKWQLGLDNMYVPLENYREESCTGLDSDK
jgi:hypothetical protein